MRLFSVVFTFVFSLVSLSSSAEARTRAPKTDNERALLYWRYLCENQPQSETNKAENARNGSIELVCPSQNWKVHSDGEQVREVVEDAKK